LIAWLEVEKDTSAETFCYFMEAYRLLTFQIVAIVADILVL